MAKVLTGISGNVISAASAAFAPTNSADVSAIASAYQVVSATATQLYAGTTYVTSVNDAPLSASRAGHAAYAYRANSAYYDGTGRLISSLPDSATVSAIASAYAESAASSKQDALTFGYDDDKISAINGSALAGQGGGGGSVVSPNGTILVTDGSSLEGTNSAVYLGPPGPLAVYASAHPSVASSIYYGGTIYRCDDESGMPAEGIDVYMAKITNSYTKSAHFTALNTSWEEAWTGTASWNSANNKAQLRFGTMIDVISLEWGNLGGNSYLSGSSTSNYSIQFLKSSAPTLVVGELAWASALPTYSYDSEDKISAINGSAIAGGGGGATGYYVEKSATSVAIGTSNTAGAWSLVVGSGNSNGRDESLIVGRNNSADMWAVAVGSSVSANLDGLAVGYKVLARLGIGVGSEASGDDGAIGVGNKVCGYNDSLIVGSYATAQNTSLGIGSLLFADSGSYALGYCANSRRNSFAHGMYVTSDYTSMAFGTYNLSGNGSASSGAAFVIGDGTAPYARHDLMVVTKDGEITMYSGTADSVGTGIMSSIRAISAAATGGGGVDSAMVSAIASSYAESAASSKLDSSASSSFYSTANDSGFVGSSYVDSAVSGKLDSTAFSNVSGNFLTSVDLSPYQTTADMTGWIPTSESANYMQSTAVQSAYASASATQATAQNVLYILIPNGV